LEDGDSSIRYGAANVLGEIGDSRAVEPLIRTLSDANSSVRSRAAWALGKIGDPRAAGPLIQALNDSDSWVKLLAASALSEIGDTTAVDPLIRDLNSTNSSVRKDAAWALGAIGDPRAVDPLILALKDEDSYVRDAAAVSLGAIGDPRALDPLIAALEDKGPSVRSISAISLGGIGGPEAVDALILVLATRDEYSTIQSDAADSLGSIGDPRAVDPLIAALQDEDPLLRGAAAQSLGEIGDCRAADPLIAALGDEESFVREEAAAALNKLNQTGARSLAGPTQQVAEEAADGIYQVDGDQVKLSDRQSLIQTSEWGEVPVNQVLVVLIEGKGRSDADRIAASLGGRVVGFFSYINLYQIETAARTEAELKDALDRARQDPDVELAFPNQQSYPDVTVKGVQCSPLDDPVYTEGGRGKGYEMIGVQNAWDLIRVSGLPLSQVHVGVVDDGLFKGNGEFDRGAKIDTIEANSELAASRGIVQYAGKEYDYTVLGSHGTGIMNLIAADPENGGIAGIASGALKDKLTISMVNNYAPPYGDNPESEPDPDDPTKMVRRNGKSYALGSLLAVNKSINMGARVISISWGDSKADPLTAAAFKKFFQKMAKDHPDVIFVCSAGNNGRALDGRRRWPSGLDLPNMITVGNVMNDGTNTAKSNMASDNFEVTLAAPSEQSVHGFNNQGNIANELGGTSMATPQVASAAAILKGLKPDLNAEQIKKIISR
jgi:HEAT repeat protein